MNDFIDMTCDNYYVNPYKCVNDTVIPSIVLDDDFDKEQYDDMIIFKLIANNDVVKLNKILSNDPKININIQDGDGDTPLHIAIFLSNYEACKILINNGANMLIKDKWGQIPIHRLCFTLKNENCLKIINLILKYSNENILNNIDKYNNTSLHLIIKYILKNNVIINKNIIRIIHKLCKFTDMNLINDDGLSLNDLINLIEI